MKKWMAKTLLAATLVLGTGAASAQQCAGFGDQPNDIFCPSVEWLKNRAITTGCQGGANYCPNDPVTRLQMALFMNRLGKALSPEVLRRHVAVNNNPTPLPPADGSGGSLVRCVTPQSTAAIYPRRAIVTASLAGLASGSSVAVNAFLLVSADNGTTFAQLNPDQIGVRMSAAAGEWGSVALSDSAPLPPGTAQAPVQYNFAIGFRRDDIVAGTTGELSHIRCNLTAAVVNDNGTASPF